MQFILSCHGISKSYGDRIILNKVELILNFGDRLGIVGRNGAGKSTLANILSGIIEADEGQLLMPKKRLRIAYLQQSETDSSLFVSELQEKVWNSESLKISKELGMAGVGNWDSRKLCNLSGGEKSKLALAEIWASHPDLLILDEPTNHLDYQGIEWMIKELSRFEGILLIISHDRYFLDRTVNKIAELDSAKLRYYPGNYTDFRRQKEKEIEKQWHDYEAQQREQRKLENSIRQLQKWSEKAHRESRKKSLQTGNRKGGKEYYRAKAKKRDKAIKSKLQDLEKNREVSIERPQEEPALSFDFLQSDNRGRRLLAAQDLSKSYPSTPLFSSSSFYLNRGEKLGVWGPNGCGKSTLFKLILGEEPMDEGMLFLSQSARVSYVSQDLPLEEKGTVLSLLHNTCQGEEKRVLNLLANLGINYDRCQVPLQNLSRGERMKVKLGLALMGEYDLLMLDEPGNHLDLPSREALEKSLINHSGGILIISHDRYLLEQVCDHMLIFKNGKIRRVEERLGEYLDNTGSRPHREKAEKSNAEQLLLLDMKISHLLSEISNYKPEDPQYQELDSQYQHLIRQKQTLVKS